MVVIILYWIPAHKDIQDNERVNELAKRAIMEETRRDLLILRYCDQNCEGWLQD